MFAAPHVMLRWQTFHIGLPLELWNESETKNPEGLKSFILHNHSQSHITHFSMSFVWSKGDTHTGLTHHATHGLKEMTSQNKMVQNEKILWDQSTHSAFT